MIKFGEKMVYVFYPLIQLYWRVVGKPHEGVQAILVHEDKVLLVKKSYFRGAWSLPGGFLEEGEHPDAALRREVYEELGIELKYIDYAGARHIGSEEEPVLVHTYSANLLVEPVSVDSIEISEAKWFPLADLPESAPDAQFLLDEFYHSKEYGN